MCGGDYSLNNMNALITFKDKLFFYLRDSYFELRHVVWPTKKQLIQHTGIVIVFSISVAIFLGILDVLFGIGIQQLILIK